MNPTGEIDPNAELKLRCFQAIMGGTEQERLARARTLWAWISGEAEKDEPKGAGGE